MNQLDGSALSEVVEQTLDRHGRNPQSLLQILLDLQRAFHCVPKAALPTLAASLGLSQLRIEGLVSFYSFLSPTFEGDYVVHLSDNITDQMSGGRELASLLCERLGVKLGETRGSNR